MTYTSRRRVALLVHTASDWTRGVLHGVASFIRERSDPWEVFLEARGFQERLSLPKGFQADGVILRLTHASLNNSVTRRKLPAVNVSWLGKHSSKVPKVVSDERLCAELGVNHLRDRGYNNLAYVGPDVDLAYSDTIRRSFETKAGSLGAAFVPEKKGSGFVEWIKKLPKPVGILAWDTATSRRILETCMRTGIHVPIDVGIVCIEHDHLMASMSQTPLTSIDQDPPSVGYEAAKLLESLMNGKASPDEPLLIRPHGLICRQSTDSTMTTDRLVSTALTFIRNNFSKPIRVTDVCEKLDVSRRHLEHRFRVSINSTPAHEIRRIKLENVKRLIVETNLSLEQIAVMCGYDYAEVMTRAFKQAFEMTPGEFRKSR